VKPFVRTNVLLLLAIAALAAAPIALGLGSGLAQPFAGSDSLAKQAIVQEHPDYKPWFSSIYQPPSGEVESALFALQAALGAGFLGYSVGVIRTRHRLAGQPPTGSNGATGASRKT
jgi:cobalt/nickel transport protein